MTDTTPKVPPADAGSGPVAAQQRPEIQVVPLRGLPVVGVVLVFLVVSIAGI